MLIDEIKQSFNDDVIYKMERFLCDSDSNLEFFEGISAQKKQEALLATKNLYTHKDSIKFCKLCHHSELVIDDWINERLCLGCYNIRNNKVRVEELLH